MRFLPRRKSSATFLGWPVFATLFNWVLFLKQLLTRQVKQSFDFLTWLVYKKPRHFTRSSWLLFATFLTLGGGISVLALPSTWFAPGQPLSHLAGLHDTLTHSLSSSKKPSNPAQGTWVYPSSNRTRSNSKTPSLLFRPGSNRILQHLLQAPGSPDATPTSLPTAAPSVVDVIVDNTDVGNVAFTGAWTTSSSFFSNWGVNYAHDGNTGKGQKSVTYTPDLPEAGVYTVYAFWVREIDPSFYATNVPFDIVSEQGTVTKIVNQRGNYSYWVPLGTYSCAQGRASSVTIRNAGTTNAVCADAVRWIKGAPPLAPSNLTATTLSDSQIQLNWVDNATDERGVLIQRAPDAIDPSLAKWSNIARLEGTQLSSYTDSDLAAGTRYFYRVVVFNAYLTDLSRSADVLPVNSAASDIADSTTTASTQEVIVDDADPSGVTITGSWSLPTQGYNYFRSGYLSDDKTGKGQKSVRFTPNLPSSGTYAVYTRWPDFPFLESGTSNPSNYPAENTPIDINTPSGTKTVIVSQQRGDTRGKWNLLGTYAFAQGSSPSNGSVTIRNDGTNSSSYVLADAVRWVKIETWKPAPTTSPVEDPYATEITMDNLDGGDAYSSNLLKVGAWTSATGGTGQWKNDYLVDGNTGQGQKSVRFSPVVPRTRYYHAYLRWVADPSRATNVPVDINHSGGINTLLVDQTKNGGMWNYIGTYEFGTYDQGRYNSNNITMHNGGANGSVCVDAVRLVAVPENSSVRTLTSKGGVIVDNEDAFGMKMDGCWNPLQAGWVTNSQYDGNILKGQKSVRLTPDLLRSGTYEVFTRWSGASDRANNTQVAINTPSGTVTRTLNQNTARGLTPWTSLGIYSFNSGISPAQGSVTFNTNGTSQIVVADAVKFEPINATPDASDGSATTAEDTPVSIPLSASDADGNTLFYRIIDGPAHGSVSAINATTHNLTYTPSPNFNGEDLFTFRVDDGLVPSRIATVSITVTPVDDLPIAVDDKYTVAEDSSLQGRSVLLNDQSPDGLQLQPVLKTSPSLGTFAFDSTHGTFTYTPPADYSGTVSFTYTVKTQVQDASGTRTAESSPATVTITVTPVNDPPRAKDDSYSTPENTTLTVVVPGVLSNDSDPDGDSLSVSLVTRPSRGTVVLGSDGSFVYTPQKNLFGPDSFVYKVEDGQGGEAQGVVSVLVTPVNQAPIARDDLATLDGVALNIPVLDNDADPDGDDLTITQITMSDQKVIPVINPDGRTVRYAASEGVAGTDWFSYTISDGQGHTTTAKVWITISKIVAVGTGCPTGAVTPGTVLIYADGGQGYVEKQQAEASGHTVTMVSASQWSAMTREQFAAYDALVFPDNQGWGESYWNTVNANKAVWSPVVTGHIVLNGGDPAYHAPPAALTFIRNSIDFATSGETTGLFVTLSHGDYANEQPLSFLDGVGDFRVTGDFGCWNDILAIERYHPVLKGLDTQQLSNWGCSAHHVFKKYPDRFVPLAFVQEVGSVPYIIATDCQSPEPTPTPSGTPIVDSTAPTVSITSPLSGGTINSLTWISGRAEDEVSGSGLDKVELTIRRDSDGLYWAGNGWGTTPVWLVSTGRAGTYWWRQAQNPTDSDLSEGSYTLAARAFDRSGNQSAPASVTCRVDRTAPTISITTPRDKETVPSLSTIKGKASDGPTGSGILKVEVSLYNAAGGLWLGQPMLAQYDAATETWSVTDGLPQGTDLPDGDYTLKAVAYDKANHSATVQSVFRVTAPTPIPTPTPQATASGTPTPTATPSPTPTPAPAKPNGLIRTAAATEFTGATVYSENATTQTVSQSVEPGAKATFVWQVRNDSLSPDTLVLSGPAESASGWSVRYFDALMGGADITTAVSGPNGYATGVLQPGQAQVVRVEVTPAPGAAPGTTWTLGLTVYSSRSAARDTVGAATTVIAPSTVKPDAALRATAATTWVGDDVYNSDATGQSITVAANPRDVFGNVTQAPATFLLRLQNDGVTADQLVLHAPVGPFEGWSAKYFDAETGGTEISSAVMSANGYSTSSLAQGQSVVVRLEVTPNANVPVRSTLSLLHRLSSKANPALEDAVRAVAAQTDLPGTGTEDAPAVDGAIQGGGAFVGTGVVNDDGTDQVAERTADAATSRAVFTWRGTNTSRTPDSLIFAASAGVPGWNIRYFTTPAGGSEVEITAQVTTENGWKSALLGQNGAATVRVEVVPATGVTPGASLRVPFSLFSSRGNAVDRVVGLASKAAATTPTPTATGTPGPTATPTATATALPTPQVDGQIKVAGEAQMTGDNVRNEDATDQQVSGSVVVDESAGSTSAPAIFFWRGQNETDATESVLMAGIPGDARWSVAYFAVTVPDQMTGGTDVTAQITGNTGWTTPALRAGESQDVRVEVRAKAGTTSQSAGWGALLGVYAVRDFNIVDRVGVRVLAKAAPGATPTPGTAPTPQPTWNATPAPTVTPLPTATAPGSTPTPPPTPTPTSPPLPKVPTPLISPEAGPYSGALRVTITESLASASVLYTLDGSDPTRSNSAARRYAGPFVLEASATVKARGFATNYVPSEAASQNYQVVRGTGSGPGVTITDPTDTNGAVVERTEPITVRGNVNASNLQFWELSYRMEGLGNEDAWVPLKSGTNTGSDLDVGKFDPTLLLNGLYELRLFAVDVAGNTAEDRVSIVVKGGMKIGHFTLSFNDLTLPVAGLPISIVRTYDTRHALSGLKGDFGVGWTLSTTNVRLQKSGPIGGSEDRLVWQQKRQGSYYSVSPVKPRLVTVTLPDGGVYNFAATFNPPGQGIIPISGGTVEFKAQRGTKGKLRAVGTDGAVYLDGTSGLVGLRNYADDDEEGGLFNPTEFILTLPSGVEIDVKENRDGTGASLQWIKDLNGNVTRFGYAGIRSYGPDGRELRAVLFGRDGQGYIQSITDARGRSCTYTRDGAGDLTGFTNRVNEITKMDYDTRHYLETITDARGVKVLAATYDPDGRLSATTDTNGKYTQMIHSVSGRNETIFDRRGTRTVMYYDSYGNVTDTKTELKDVNGIFQRWIIGRTAYADADNPDQPTAVTRYLENGRAITTTMAYDKDGNVTSVTDPLNHTTLATYQKSRVTAVQDARAIAGNYTTVSNVYDAKGNLTSSTDALGYATSFTYYSSGTPATVTDAQGHTTTFRLNSQGNIDQVTDAAGHSTSFVFDANGNKTSTSTTRTMGGSVQTLTSQVAYDDESRPTVATAPDGVQSRVIYNSIGQIDRSIRALGTPLERVTQYRYNVLSQRLRTIYPDGGTTPDTLYDDAGQVEASFDRVGRGSYTRYDSLGRAVRSYQVLPGSGAPETRLVKDGAGNALYSETKYDDLGRVIASRDTRGRWSYSRYDDAGNVKESEDSLGRVTKSDYDVLNRAYRITDAKNHVTTTTYDNAGRVTQVTFHDGTFTQTRYDELNRAVEVEDQLRRVKRMHYDVLGRMDWIELPVSAGRWLRTRFGYNELGQKIWQQDGRGVTTDFQAGRDINTAAPVSRVTQFAYDERGRMTARLLPGKVAGQSLIEAMEYNALGQTTRSRDFRGYWTRYDYDVRGRMLSKLPDAALTGEPGVFYEYPDELTTRLTRGSNVTETHQDANRGWMNSLSAPGGNTISYAHDAWGRTLSSTIASGVGANASTRLTSYGYDGLDRLQTLTAPDAKQWSYGYDEIGNKTTLTRPNGVVTSYGYDTLNRLTDLVNQKGAVEQSRMHYRVRDDGRRDQLSESLRQPDGTQVTRTVSYAFDDANRLTGESGQDGKGVAYSKSYVLDDAGNRVSSTDTRAVDGATPAKNSNSTYLYDDNDWLTSLTTNTSASGSTPASSSTTAYLYDKNGSQVRETTNGQATAQVWDFEGHLVARGSIDAGGAWTGTRQVNSFDAAGLRVKQSSMTGSSTVSASTAYLWSGDHVVEERDKDGVLAARYDIGQEMGPLRLEQQVSGATQERYFTGDGQDSTRQLTNESGNVTDSYFYDAFGNGLEGGQAPSANKFLYTGQQADGGLYYLRARFYAPGTGRFLSHDPVLGSMADPISMHRYLYAGIDPVNMVDPSGREFSLAGAMVTGAIIGSIGGGLHAAANGGSPMQIVGGVLLGGTIGAVLPAVGVAGVTLAGSTSAVSALGGAAILTGLAAGGGWGLAHNVYEDIETLGGPTPTWRKMVASLDIAFNVGVPFVANKVQARISYRLGRSARYQSVVTAATNWQGSGRYPGVDTYVGQTHQEGEYVYQTWHGNKTEPGEYFFPAEVLDQANGSAQKLAELIQIHNPKSKNAATGDPDPAGYLNTEIKIFRVVKKFDGADGLATNNRHHGDGGGAQIFVPEPALQNGSLVEVGSFTLSSN